MGRMALKSTRRSPLTQRQQQLSEALEQILHCLVAQYQPERVILFGSMARDAVSEWSDLDFVIIKDTPLPFLQRLREVVLLCRPTVGVDFLVYTPAEWAQMIEKRNPFAVEEVIRRGKVIYERQSAGTVAVARN